MPDPQPVKAINHLREHDWPIGLAEYVPLAALGGILAGQHLPPFAEYLRTLVPPFDVLNYLHQFGHLIARLYPESNVPAPGFTPIVLPRTNLASDSSGEAEKSA